MSTSTGTSFRSRHVPHFQAAWFGMICLPRTSSGVRLLQVKRRRVALVHVRMPVIYQLHRDLCERVVRAARPPPPLHLDEELEKNREKGACAALVEVQVNRKICVASHLGIAGSHLQLQVIAPKDWLLKLLLQDTLERNLEAAEVRLVFILLGDEDKALTGEHEEPHCLANCPSRPAFEKNVLPLENEHLSRPRQRKKLLRNLVLGESRVNRHRMFCSYDDYLYKYFRHCALETTVI
mmetsp:Transcript_24366/g.61277  ORF Transcript_24366/g.61277 Transcript_24366/m.61277 type:complete len:237 (+) Transcript_24366:592-1302(+)